MVFQGCFGGSRFGLSVPVLMCSERFQSGFWLPPGRLLGGFGWSRKRYLGKFLHALGVSLALAGGAAPPGPPALPKIFKIWKQNKNPAKSCVRSLYMYHQH